MREKPLSNQTLMDLCGGLALLLHAGVGTADGLDLLGQQQEEPALAKLLTDLILALASYQVQLRWVFAKGKNRSKDKTKDEPAS